MFQLIKVFLIIVSLFPMFSKAKVIGIQANLVGLAYPALQKKSFSSNIGLEIQFDKQDVLKPSVNYFHLTSEIDYGNEIYKDEQVKFGVRFQWKHYYFQNHLTGFFYGVHGDFHQMKRTISCITKSNGNFVRFEKTDGFIIGAGFHAGYTFQFKQFTIEPNFGVGGSGATRNLIVKNRQDDNSYIYLSPTFFHVNFGYRF